MNKAELNSHDLAIQRTELAFERTKRSSQRTLMAWIRTSLSMISFGFSIDTFFRALAKVKGLFETDTLFEPTLLGLVLVGLGTTVMILGIVEHILYLREIHAHLHLTGTKGPWTYMLGVALFISLVGITIFFYLLIINFCR